MARRSRCWMVVVSEAEESSKPVVFCFCFFPFQKRHWHSALHCSVRRDRIRPKHEKPMTKTMTKNCGQCRKCEPEPPLEASATGVFLVKEHQRRSTIDSHQKTIASRTESGKENPTYRPVRARERHSDKTKHVETLAFVTVVERSLRSRSECS